MEIADVRTLIDPLQVMRFSKVLCTLHKVTNITRVHYLQLMNLIFYLTLVRGNEPEFGYEQV